MNRRQKEQYLQEYHLLKDQGKAFFPYAVLKDSVAAIVVLGVVILLSLILGGELNPKADPTTMSYDPRPEWYFFFLFQLLRLIKNPNFVILATIGIPTIALILLLLLPFYDRGPERRIWRRPLSMTMGVATIGIMVYLTYTGANALAPNQIELSRDPATMPGQEVAVQVACGACHKFGSAGNDGPGPNLTHIGAKLPAAAIRRSLCNPPPPMPSFCGLPPEKLDDLVNFLSSLR